MDLSHLCYTCLPSEIIVDIFTRLPTKIIGQCRCLSKTWKSMLSTPEFIKTHLAHITKFPQQSTSLLSNCMKSMTLSNAHHLFDEITSSSRTLTFDVRHVFLVGSCNGLVLVNAEHNFFIINPTTQQINQVPFPPFPPGPRDCLTVSGLGYHSVHDDYKIVAISTIGFNRSVHIYSVNNGTWKKCETSLYDLGLSFHYSSYGIFVESCLHWLADHSTADSSKVITKFNIRDERFDQLSMHSSFGNPNSIFQFIKLEVLGGCLCNCYYDGDHFVIWMMKEYGVYESWTKLVIPKPNIAKIYWPMCIMGPRDNLVVFRVFIPTSPSKQGKLVTYNLEEKTLKDVNSNVIDDTPFSFWITYMETLVSPHGSNKMIGECSVNNN